jgi:diguanylate cyclase (GGDEF)-like protein
MRPWSDRFIPETLHGDADALSRARLMVHLSTVLIAIAAPYAVVFATVFHFRAGAIILGVGTCIAPIALGLLRINPRLHLAGHALTSVLYAAIVALMCYEGGIRSLATPWLIMPPMFATLLLGRRAAWGWTTISVATIVVFSRLQARGIQFPVGYSEEWATRITAGTYAGLVVCTAILVFVFEDIRAAAQARAESASVALAQLAYVDALTGLANRARFLDRLEAALGRAAVGGEPQRIAILLIDLDGFKAVNDSLGHTAGDALLTEVAVRLLDATRGRDTVARLGGDEFAILLDGLHQDSDTAVVAERIVSSIGKPFVLMGQRASIGASIGIARAPVTGEFGPAITTSDAEPLSPAAALLHEADLALYRAKRLGKGRWVRFQANWPTPTSRAS